MNQTGAEKCAFFFIVYCMILCILVIVSTVTGLGVAAFFIVQDFCFYCFFFVAFFRVCADFKLMMFLIFYTLEGKRRSKSDGSDSGEENLSKKDLALQQAIDQITSAYGKGSIMWLGRSMAPKNVPVVSTGSFALDIALGVGGLPKASLCLLLYLNRFELSLSLS